MLLLENIGLTVNASLEGRLTVACDTEGKPAGRQANTTQLQEAEYADITNFRGRQR